MADSSTTEAQLDSGAETDDIATDVNPSTDDGLDITRNEEGIRKIADLIVKAVDEGALKRYHAIGKEAYKHATWQRKNFKGAYESKDFKRLCDKIADEVRLTVEVDVRVKAWVRLYLWCEDMKPLVPDVMQLSYNTVANHLLPTLYFSESDLSHKIREEWVEFMKDAATKLLAGSLGIRDLKESITKQEHAIKAAAVDKRTPEAKIEAERKAVLAERTKKEAKARTDVTTSMDTALGTLPVSDVMAIVEKLAKDREIILPAPSNIAASMTADEARAFARALNLAGNIEAMMALHKTIGAMLKALETAGATLNETNGAMVLAKTG